MKFNFRSAVVAAFLVFSQPLFAQENTEIERQVTSTEKDKFVYRFPAETDYILYKKKELFRGHGTEVDLTHLEDGTYYMMYTKPNGKNVLDEFVKG